jgi:ABC-2 type transport system permease protein
MKWGMLDMPSRTSWINKELIIQSLRNVGWLGIVYFIGLLFALPIDILGKLTNPNLTYYNNIYENLFKMQYPIQMGLLFLIPVLLAVFLFRYLHVKQSADFIHSLPVKRNKIFHHALLTGLGILLIPILLNTVFLLVLYWITELSLYIDAADIFVWGGITLLMSFLFFLTGTFIAMVTGLSAVQGVLTYIILILPAGMFLLVTFSLKQLLFGFPTDYYYTIKIEEYSPIVKAAMLENKMISGWDALIYAALTIAFYFLALLLYKNRKIESASQPITFQLLQPIFKYSVTFCAMLVGGMYFTEVQGQGYWIWFGYVVGALFGYYVAEMILQKHWRVFHQWKGYVVYLLVIGAASLLFQFDLFQYEKKVPEAGSIKEAYVGYSYYDIFNSDAMVGSVSEDGFVQEIKRDPMLKEEDSIKAVRNLHKAIINKGETSTGYDRMPAFFYYKLEDGSTLVRSYEIDQGDLEEYYSDLYETREYKEATNDIFHIDEEKIDKLTLHQEFTAGKTVTIVDPGEIKEAISILKQEIYNESFEDQNRLSTFSVELLLSNNQRTGISVRNTYDEFEQWLRDKEYLEKIKVTADDIEWIYVIDKKEHTRELMKADYPGDIFPSLKEQGTGLEIKEKEKLNEILENLSYDRQKNPYLVGIKYKGQPHVDVSGLTEEDAPSFVKQAFE